MPAYIQETGRSYPNPVKGGGFNQTFKRPSSGKYRTSSDYPGQGTGMAYNITFEDGGPGSPAYLNLKELLDLIFKVMNDHEKRFPESADWALDVQDKMKAEIQKQVYREIDEKIADKYEALEARLNIIEDKLSE